MLQDMTAGIDSTSRIVPFIYEYGMEEFESFLPTEIFNQIVTNQGNESKIKEILINYDPYFFPPQDEGYSQATASVYVSSYPIQAFLKVIMPVIILTGIALIPFWMDPKDISTKIALGVGSLLTVVFFSLQIETTLPNLPYLTIADKTNLTAYGTILYSIISCVIVKRKIKDENNLEDVKKINKLLRWAIPIVVIAIAVPLFLLD